MKRLAILLLIGLIACSGIIYPIDDIENNLPPIPGLVTITGVYRGASAYRQESVGDVWYNARNATTSTDNNIVYNGVNGYAYAGAEWIVGGQVIISRAGMIFNISSVPSGSIIDSVFLSLYNFGSANISVAIYEANYLTCLTGTDRDYMKYVGSGLSLNYKLITYNATTSSGYNVFRLGTSLPPSFSDGVGYCAYGVGEYAHDYLNSNPIPNRYVFQFWFGNLGTKEPILEIYYHAVPTPAPKKIKIITII